MENGLDLITIQSSADLAAESLCVLAQNLLRQRVFEDKVDVCIICEQHSNLRDGTWYPDDTGTAAIWIVNTTKVTVNSSGCGAGFVWIETPTAYFMSVYLSPNEGIITLGKCHTAIFLKLGIQVVHENLLDTYFVISAQKPFEGHCPLLKRTDPEFFKKVSLLLGDLEKPNLGLSDYDKEIIIKQVNCIFHCGGATGLCEALETATFVNVRATRDLLEIAKRAEDLKVGVVDVS
ncbi:hypothetical protein NQ318_019445 [Aromia moschata]|uniref:Fatty acyl-CoA reductase n=1 Tax=Aromia moschata TaxID=1265417 RepID=A0AAV8XKY9_9CUCU|nr:hypothetical protein NQ318_019445 [Aromia moschata]